MAERLRVARILWVALMGSVCIYAALAFAVLPDVPETPDPILLYVLGAVALSVAGASFVIPAQLYTKRLAAQQLPTEEVPDHDAETLFRDAAPTVRVFSDPKGALASAVPHYFVFIVLRLALREAIATFGLVLHFMGFADLVVAPFFVVALALQAIGAPRQSEVVESLERAHDAKLRF